VHAGEELNADSQLGANQSNAFITAGQH
jgi:hypothetical protein